MEEKILEEFETADPETHTVDPVTGNHVYWGEKVVGHRIHETEGLQYIVRYKNKQLQWWNAVDVKNCFPNHLRSYKRSKKGRRKTATYTKNQSFVSSSAEPTPSPAKDERRVSKRKLSTFFKEEEAEPENETGEKSVPDSPGRSSIIIASTSSVGQFKKLKSTPMPSTPTLRVKRVVLTEAKPTTDSKNGSQCKCNASKGQLGQSTELCSCLSAENGDTSNTDKPVDDPLDFNSVAMKHAQAITDSMAQSLRAARESDMLEIEKLKASNVNLEELLNQKENEIADMRKQHEEILADKEIQCEELAKENERIKLESLKALRDIVGNGRYEESDDTSTLKKKAMVLIQQLDCFLNATKTAQRIVESENIKPNIVCEQIE